MLAYYLLLERQGKQAVEFCLMCMGMLNSDYFHFSQIQSVQLESYHIAV